MKNLSACAFVMLIGLPLSAANFDSSARGTTAANFLTQGVGARAVSMGSAYSAAADEASALYWNPAALTRIPRRSTTFMHAAYLDSSYLDYGAYGQNLGAMGAFGVGVQYFNAGAITQTDASGTEIGKFSPYHLAVSLGYGYEFEDFEFFPDLNGFAVGASAKFIRSQILNSAQAGAADIGVLSPAWFDKRFRLAVTATNLGGGLVYDQVRQSLPTTLTVGSAYNISDRWLATLDVAVPRNDQPHVGVGTEYWLPTSGPWKFAGRAGFNSQSLGSVDGFFGPSLGFGIKCRGYALDYGFVPIGGIGQAHRVSLTFNF